MVKSALSEHDPVCEWAHNATNQISLYLQPQQPPAPPPPPAAAPPSGGPVEYDEGAVIEGGGVKKKKRPGLSDGLVPGKKAMKFHNRVYNAS